jgi:hypothetical protein
MRQRVPGLTVIRQLVILLIWLLGYRVVWHRQIEYLARRPEAEFERSLLDSGESLPLGDFELHLRVLPVEHVEFAS